MLIASRSTMFTEDGEYKGLKFTALSAGSTVSMNRTANDAPIVSVQYSFNGRDWQQFEIGTDQITLSNADDYVYFAATNAGNQQFANGWVNSTTMKTTRFAFSGAVKASGNCMSLIDNTMRQDHFTKDSAFGGIFSGTSALVDASDLKLPLSSILLGSYSFMFGFCTSLSSVENLELPAMSVPQGAYDGMFYNCTSLKKAMKVLPGITLGYAPYQGMFQNCTSLSTPPEICAMQFTSGESCSRMFYGCTSLTAAPELPATSLNGYCYNYMFYNCKSLSSTPDMTHISSSAEGCFRYMFSQCSKLTHASDLSNITNGSIAGICESMFANCTSLSTPPALPSAENAQRSCYQNMFSSCTSLTSAPALQATTLEASCYYNMFYGCSHLSKAPSMTVLSVNQHSCYSMFNNCSSLSNVSNIYLSASSLANYCYARMFYNCRSISSAPALPATTLANYCYNNMFYGCSSLTATPDLPASSLANYCYNQMFYNCFSLSTASDLSATTLASYCYSNMFTGCRSLSTAPFLPATALVDYCYASMFYNCSSLSYINAKLSAWSPSNATEQWVNGVASTGTFVCSPALSIVHGNNYIPTGWDVAKPFTLHALEAGSTVKMASSGSNAPSISLEYSLDSTTWNTFTVDSRPLILQNVGDFVSFRAGNGGNSAFANGVDYNYFQMTGKLSSSGNIMYLLDKDLKQNSLTAEFIFSNLFNDCSSLVSPPQLPAMQLSEHCYSEMFRNCTSLSSMPELPATSLTENCYYYMFAGCTALSAAMPLPAQELAFKCYMGMFRYCSSLTAAPKLPATQLSPYCYSMMFDSCTSLQMAPKMPAQQLQNYCYRNMFNGCTSLSSMTVNFNDWSIDVTDPTTNWLSGVSPTGEFTCNEQLSDVRGPSNIPVGWTLKRKAQELTFTAVEANSTVAMQPLGSPSLTINLLYSLNGASWQPFTVNSTVVTLPNVGDTVKFKAGSYNYRFGSSTTVGYHFVMTGKIAASGPIGSIMDPQNLDVVDVLSTYAFANLFNGCSSLTEAPEINVRQTTTGTLYKLFCSCDNLINAPSLDSLSNVTTNTCSYMFAYCSKLKTIPDLTLIPTRSYIYMFRECTSLNEITVSFISSATGATNMFNGCSNLSSVTASQLTSWNGTSNWLSGVAANGEFYCKHALPEQYGASYIPTGWNVNYLD